ncbi:MAG: DNA polymerase IV [Chloroflexi bacterium]|nr:DNA polymerase IV [Chloroflexota bacterium]
MNRQIVHVDLDAFFASVECLLNPSLVGKPLLVGGAPGGRGVVSAASYEARARGVRSAMPMAQALRLCPEAVRVPPRHGTYGHYSRAVMALLAEYTPVVEQVSIDEAFLDLSGTEGLHGPAEDVARAIQGRVQAEHGLPCSLGVATNKLVAKIACSQGKPRGLVVVPPGGEAAFLAPLSIESLWGVGEATGKRLRALGIDTVGDLASWTEASLRSLFGEAGTQLFRAAHGIDESPVSPDRERRSYSHERTFASDESDVAHVRRTILAMSDDLAAQLRRDGTVAQTVRLKLRSRDFTTYTRQVRLEHPTDVADEICSAATALLEENWDRRSLRLVGVGVTDLLGHGGIQLSMFDEGVQRQRRLSQALDGIRARYGHEAITRASLAGNHSGGEDDLEDEP